MDFAALQRIQREAASHQTRDDIVLTVFASEFGRKKHRRIAAPYDNLVLHGVAFLEQFDFGQLAVGTRADNHAVGGRAQAGQFADADERPHPYPMADLSDLSANRMAAWGNVAEQFSFDYFATLPDAEQVLDSAAQCAR